MSARSLVATAPVRICDVGGWTDTWFARSGAVLSIAVEPLVVVEVLASRTRDARVRLAAPDLGERCDYVLGAPPGRLLLLEAAIASATIPTGTGLEITIRAGVPPGCGTGTSAAVVVALLAALDRLTPGVTPPSRLAAAAHRVETDRLGQQSGVQDQLASAHGGINLFEVRYPDATAHPVLVEPAVGAALEDRLVLVALGRPHRSSAVHEEVIARLARAEGAGGALDVLRGLAHDAATALAGGDLEGLGAAMRSATEAQRALHPALVSGQAQELVDVAAGAGASGWKVNGAGGDGGSLTFLAGPAPGGRAALLAAVGSVAGPHHVVPVRIARHGVSVVDSGV